MVGILKISLCGTRDAAVNFQKDVARLMTCLGLNHSKYNASLYGRIDRNTRDGRAGGFAVWGGRESGDLTMLVHGDDFVATGEREAIAKSRKSLKKRFTVKDKNHRMQERPGRDTGD